MNTLDLILLILLLLILCGAVFLAVKGKRKECGNGCSGCPLRGTCDKKRKQNSGE